jgi:hypothetical protein
VRLAINGGSRPSDELSQALQTILFDADEDEVVTLGEACERLKEMLAEEGADAGRSGDGGQTIYGELQALVEEYGEDAPAYEFVALKASDALSGVIEALLEQGDADEVTIGRVREAVQEAMIDPDAEQTLVAELDVLIDRYGEDALAEDVLPSA